MGGVRREEEEKRREEEEVNKPRRPSPHQSDWNAVFFFILSSFIIVFALTQGIIHYIIEQSLWTVPSLHPRKCHCSHYTIHEGDKPLATVPKPTSSTKIDSNKLSFSISMTFRDPEANVVPHTLRSIQVVDRDPPYLAPYSLSKSSHAMRS